MHILAYKGTSLTSRLIRWQTRSPYSHVAIEDDNGLVYEAWQGGGVRCLTDYTEGHKKGTVIDVFSITGDYHRPRVRAFAMAQVGKSYDYKSVFRFVSRRETRRDDHWFCSELVASAFMEGGIVLQNHFPSRLSPRDICISPHLQYLDTRTL